MGDKITSFKDLIAWQEGHKLVLYIYKLTTEFPKTETFSLIDQMRRAVVSITSNLAEGFGRNTYKDKLQFYYIAKGSLIEIENQTLIAKDLNYISENEFVKLSQQIELTQRLVQGLIIKSRTFV